ncbi:MAG: signal peptidase I [Erysipelotrichaceae bacterium]|nr:signal peptidase I [Erysipelotrichaceae bacterium]
MKPLSITAFLLSIIVFRMEKKQRSLLVELLILLLQAGAIVLILINFVLIPCVVEGSSMYPNLEAGDFGYSFILTKNLGLKRFDVVVIKTSDSSSKLIVKRVIGLPNETVEYIDNCLYINGEYIEEPFLVDAYTSDFTEKLGSDEYFCMGDNRAVSRDSRFYGPFESKMIRSSHLFIIYPFNRIGFR